MTEFTPDFVRLGRSKVLAAIADKNGMALDGSLHQLIGVVDPTFTKVDVANICQCMEAQPFRDEYFFMCGTEIAAAIRARGNTDQADALEAYFTAMHARDPRAHGLQLGLYRLFSRDVYPSIWWLIINAGCTDKSRVASFIEHTDENDENDFIVAVWNATLNMLSDSRYAVVDCGVREKSYDELVSIAIEHCGSVGIAPDTAILDPLTGWRAGGFKARWIGSINGKALILVANPDTPEYEYLRIGKCLALVERAGVPEQFAEQINQATRNIKHAWAPPTHKFMKNYGAHIAYSLLQYSDNDAALTLCASIIPAGEFNRSIATTVMTILSSVSKECLQEMARVGYREVELETELEESAPTEQI